MSDDNRKSISTLFRFLLVQIKGNITGGVHTTEHLLRTENKVSLNQVCPVLSESFLIEAAV